MNDLFSDLRKCRARRLALIGQAVSEKKMLEYFVHIHVYSPGAGADNPMDPKIFS